MRVLVLIGILILGSCPALAGEQDRLDQARTAYAEGRWTEAESLAGDIDTAEGQLIAAEATIAALLTFEDGLDRKRTARRALAYAEEAIELAPESSRAHQRLATALGLHSRHYSPLRVWFARMPHRGRDHIDQALRLTPDDPWVQGLSGAWHLEVVRKCDPGCLGADLQTGLEQYRRAAESAPDDPGIAFHLALALLAENPDLYREEALSWLDQASRADPEDAFEEDMIEMARQMRSRLERDLQDARATALGYLDQ